MILNPRPKGEGFCYLCAMQTVLITGGTGMVGQALTNTLIEKGYEVIVLTRTPKRSSRLQLSYAEWDVKNQYIDPAAIKKATIFVHLAGESVASKRWTTKRKQEIIDSRVQTGQLLAKVLQENKHQVHTFISASAIGWYGPDNEKSRDQGFSETDPMDNSYLGTTCGLWESSTDSIKVLGIRHIVLRIGIVLNKRGGALAEFVKPAKFGLATILGKGNQIVSWIHQIDLCNIILFAIENKQIEGIYNAVAPNPVSNKELTLTVASKYFKHHLNINVPVFILKIMLGEMSIEVLKSAKVSSKKLQQQGFEFNYSNIIEAIDNLLP
jgi:uncharacterized protein (TIGR01777 family)